MSFEFLDAIDAAITLIMERPDAWPRDSVLGERVLRRLVMRRFPSRLLARTGA
ncbi:MAG: hypothetical protein H7138_23370 [Myxococcales bacterium]|nr:hypothetical protein [Myxococcales bacterium]